MKSINIIDNKIKPVIFKRPLAKEVLGKSSLLNTNNAYISKPSELPTRKYFPLYAPNFGNFFNYIDLPEFIENQIPEEPFLRSKLRDLLVVNYHHNKHSAQLSTSNKDVNMVFKKDDNNEKKLEDSKYIRPYVNKRLRKDLTIPHQILAHENLFEKYSDIEFYINSKIDNIIYSKFPIQGKTISLNNIVNINKILNEETVKHVNEPLPDNTFAINKVKDHINIEFESRFESGNLHSAYLYEDDSFNLILQNDTNTNGYNQWFFFRVSVNKRKLNNNNNYTAKFNIINMSQKFSLFNEGLKISVYSEQIAKNEKIGWHRSCDNILFYRNGLYKFIGENRKNFSSLTFTYTFKHDNDQVFFAMNTPFTYTKLNHILNNFSKNDKKYK